MNTLVQNNNLFIGDEKEITFLKNKDSARLLIVSDIHGNEESFQTIIEKFGPTCDCLVSCGDGLGDLARLLSDAQDDDSLRFSIPSVIVAVKGNCDLEEEPVPHDPQKEVTCAKKVKVHSSEIFAAAKRTIFVTHGNKYHIELGLDALISAAKKNKAHFALFGHSHKAFYQEIEGCAAINPGSCSSPRGGTEPSFAILNLLPQNEYKVQFFGIRNGDYGKKDFVIL